MSLSIFQLIHQDPISFSDMLLDLYNTIKPNLTIVDAVVGMEGPGPGAGYPRRLGLVIAGVSSIAVDTVCAQILGFADKEVPTVWLAKKRGIKEADLENIDVIGERLRDVAIGDLKKPRTSAITLLPRFLMNLGKSFLTEKPTVLHDRCIGCANCESICSAQAIAMVELTPSFDYGKCIRCYYCHEICPSNAITLKASILSALINNDKP
jgi:ferredoxin